MGRLYLLHVGALLLLFLHAHAVSSKPVMIEIKDCAAAAFKDDHALFEYLNKNGFSAATTNAPLVDFLDPHTRVTRYPDCLLHIRTVLAKASEILVDKKGNHYTTGGKARQVGAQSESAETLVLQSIEKAYERARAKRNAALFEPDEIEGDGLRDLKQAKRSQEQEPRQKQESRKVITLSFDSKVKMYGEIGEKIFTMNAREHKQSKGDAVDSMARLKQLSLGDLPWYLDRIATSLTPDNSYLVNGNYSASAQPHWVFVMGTGIMPEHQEFIDPLTNESIVRETVFDAYPGHVGDRNGHETLTASLIAGRYFARGPANVVLFDVVVLDKNGEGWLSDITSGVTSIYYYLREHNTEGIPNSINMSLGGAGSQRFAETLRGLFELLRNEFDTTVFASAGNDHVDACGIVPAGLSQNLNNVITVASSGRSDGFSSFSNFGSCVTAIAPGEDILGASNRCPTCYSAGSGTSFSAPLLHRLFIISRSVNLTDIWLERNKPPVVGAFCQWDDAALIRNESVNVAYWSTASAQCINGQVIYGSCDDEDIVEPVSVCVNGTEDSLLCLNGTWELRYLCPGGNVDPTPEETGDVYGGDLVLNTYLTSDLVIDFLMRYNSYANAVYSVPSSTSNRFVVLNDQLWMGARNIVYSYVRTFSMVGNNKPGLDPMYPLVTPGLPSTIPIDSRYSRESNTLVGTVSAAGARLFDTTEMIAAAIFVAISILFTL